MDNNHYDQNVFDAQGYRYNVGIIIINALGQVFWGKRAGQDSWQFPQGGLSAGESSEQAMLRELFEETGLLREQVEIIGETEQWLRYRLPVRYRRRRKSGVLQCIGQKQKWFLVKLTGSDADVNLHASGTPEFDDWRWIDFWRPSKEVVHFKRRVYRQALEELSVMVPELVSKPPAMPDDMGQSREGQGAEKKHRHRSRRKAPSFARSDSSRSTHEK